MFPLFFTAKSTFSSSFLNFLPTYWKFWRFIATASNPTFLITQTSSYRRKWTPSFQKEQSQFKIGFRLFWSILMSLRFQFNCCFFNTSADFLFSSIASYFLHGFFLMTWLLVFFHYETIACFFKILLDYVFFEQILDHQISSC